MLPNIMYMNTSSKNSLSALLRQLMLYRVQGSRHYAALVDDFIRSYMPGGELTQTPCGLAWRHGVGPLRYAGTSNESSSPIKKNELLTEWGRGFRIKYKT